MRYSLLLQPLFLITLFVALVGPTAALRSETGTELRDEYYKAIDDSDAADLFYEKMQAVPDTASARDSGYKGLAALVQSKHSFNPINKMRYFSEGQELLDSAITKDPNNVELRFFRFTVQDNAPFFLNYSSDKESDRAVFIPFVSDPVRAAAEPDLAKRITEYLKENG
jgi:hypothetical protein